MKRNDTCTAAVRITRPAAHSRVPAAGTSVQRRVRLESRYRRTKNPTAVCGNFAVSHGRRRTPQASPSHSESPAGRSPTDRRHIRAGRRRSASRHGAVLGVSRLEVVTGPCAARASPSPPCVSTSREFRPAGPDDAEGRSASLKLGKLKYRHAVSRELGRQLASDSCGHGEVFSRAVRRQS